VKPETRHLTFRFNNPFNTDLVGLKPRKDPFRKQKLPLDFRIRIVERLDCWQLATIGLMMLLPLRPEELEGILIGDVDFRDRTICIRERLDGADFGKTHQSVYYPFPEKLVPILVNCIGDRQEGPLLQRRAVYEYCEPVPGVADREHLEQEVRDAILAAGSKAVTALDRKKLVRKYFRSIGGLEPNSLAREFKDIIPSMGVRARFYDLRHDVTADMRRCGIQELEMHYLTSHSTNDILNECVGLEPDVEMNKWFEKAGGLIDVVRARAESLECVDYRDPLAPVEVINEYIDEPVDREDLSNPV
jgi:integrase